MDSVKSLMAGLVILAFIVGTGTGYLLSTPDEPCKTVTADACPAGVTSLDALTVALHDPEVVGLLGNKSISTITFSSGSYSEEDIHYIQIVFHPLDPNPEDRMTASMVVVQINDSCMVHAAYETYPSYIPKAAPET